MSSRNNNDDDDDDDDDVASRSTNTQHKYSGFRQDTVQVATILYWDRETLSGKKRMKIHV
jgi:hypothetical protein